MYVNKLDNFAVVSDGKVDESTPNEGNENENNQENNQENNKEKENDAMSPPEEMAAPPASKPHSNKNSWIDVLGNGELKLKIMKRVKRRVKPQPTDLCDIRLLGRLEDGKIIEKHDFLRIQIGDHEVVQGLELALPLIGVGEKAQVIVGPRFAYGKLGNPPNIPPNATVRYVVELLTTEMETPLENIPHDVRMTTANVKREKGNWWYARHDASKAVQCYKKAADLLDETIAYVTPEGDTIENSPEKTEIVLRERIKVFNNLAAAQLMMEAYDSALASVLEVLKHEPHNVKALFRKSKILLAKGSINEAMAPLRQASLLEPQNTAVLSELHKCIKLAEIERQDEKNLYRKMLGQISINEKAKEKTMPLPNQGYWKKLWGPAATAAVMAAVAVALSYKFKNYPFL